MAYMHKQTFDIALLGKSDYEYNRMNSAFANDEDYFQVDDLIALPIQVFKPKGIYHGSCLCRSSVCH